MEGSDPKEKLRGSYFEALKKNWMLWPAVQAINFKFVPLEGRVLVVNVVSLGEFNVFIFLVWERMTLSGLGRTAIGGLVEEMMC